MSGASTINFRIDKPELPTYDVRVRKALSMAIDREAIVRDYYNGNGEAFNWQAMNISEFADMFILLAEYSEDMRAQHEYNH